MNHINLKITDNEVRFEGMENVKQLMVLLTTNQLVVNTKITEPDDGKLLITLKNGISSDDRLLAALKERNLSGDVSLFELYDGSYFLNDN